MIKMDVVQIEAVGTQSTQMYSNFKDIFPALKRFIDNAGDNCAADVIFEQAQQAENSFNNSVLPAFTSFKDNIMTYIDNKEAWERVVTSLEPLNLNSLDNTEVKKEVKAFDAE